MSYCGGGAGLLSWYYFPFFRWVSQGAPNGAATQVIATSITIKKCLEEQRILQANQIMQRSAINRGKGKGKKKQERVS